MNIGGTIRFDGEGLKWAKRGKDGGVTLSFEDQGSCETNLEFSPENTKRVAAVAGLLAQAEDTIRFKDGKGDIQAADVYLLLHNQDVIFDIEEDDIKDPNNLPTIQIRPNVPGASRYTGLFLAFNVAQAEELRRRLGLFLDAYKSEAEASKPRRIARPAAAKRVRASI
jgi:hypothetical protein